MNTNSTLTGVKLLLIIIAYVILPFLIDIAFYLFICFAFNLNIELASNRNIIAIVSSLYFYMFCALLFYVFHMTTGKWIIYRERFGWLCEIVLTIFFPIYFLCTLPITMYYFVKWIGTPADIWEITFGETCMSLTALTYEDAQNHCKLAGRFVYIGLPFGIWFILYLFVAIFISPLIYVLFSPMGFGSFGMVMFYAIREKDSMGYTITELIEYSYNWCLFYTIWCLAFPCILLSMFYMIFVQVLAWHAILLLVLAGLFFLIFFFPGSQIICCDSFARQIPLGEI